MSEETIYKPYEWTFNTEEVATVFDDHVRQSVPFYSVFHDMIRTFAKYYIEPWTTVLDIGCSTGVLLSNIAIDNYAKSGVHYVGVDDSQAMINVANDTTPATLGICFKQADVQHYDWNREMSFAYSMLTMQFIPLTHRQDILNNVYKGLRDGGAFVMVEKVKSIHTDIHDIYNDTYYDFKRKMGLSDTDILDKNVSLRGVMRPLTVEQNIEMLKQAGFKHVEVFMKYNNFAGFIAVK